MTVPVPAADPFAGALARLVEIAQVHCACGKCRLCTEVRRADDLLCSTKTGDDGKSVGAIAERLGITIDDEHVFELPATSNVGALAVDLLRHAAAVRDALNEQESDAVPDYHVEAAVRQIGVWLHG